MCSALFCSVTKYFVIIGNMIVILLYASDELLCQLKIDNSTVLSCYFLS